MDKDLESVALIDFEELSRAWPGDGKTATRWVASGRMPAPVMRMGTRRLWRRREIVEWLANGCRMPEQAGT